MTTSVFAKDRGSWTQKCLRSDNNIDRYRLFAHVFVTETGYRRNLWWKYLFQQHFAIQYQYQKILSVMIDEPVSVESYQFLFILSCEREMWVLRSSQLRSEISSNCRTFHFKIYPQVCDQWWITSAKPMLISLRSKLLKMENWKRCKSFKI